MKRLNRIMSAEEDSKLLDTVDDLKSDFDYIVSGLEKLDRSGAEAQNNGLIIAENLRDTFQNVIANIADDVTD